MDSTTAPPPKRERLLFLDALRGLALILMVLNHTPRWWQDGSMRWPRYYLIYVTLTLAAPMFLFLVGFCVPLSTSKSESAVAALSKGLRRGVRLILAGLLLNLLVFPDPPLWKTVWNNGVLQTIGFSILIATPGALLLRSRACQWGLLAVAVLGYLAFWWAFPQLTQFVAAHPAASKIFFFEFPPWPWLCLVLVGLVLGGWWVRQPDRRARARYMWVMAAAGVLCLLWFFGWDWWAQTSKRWMFTRDFSLNNHWTPRGAMLAWVTGMIFCQMAAFYWTVEILRVPVRWLVILGQTALFLYFTHHFIVLTLINERLGIRLNNWPRFVIANLLLLALLVWMGWAWLEMKRVYRDRWRERVREVLPALSVFRRA